MNPLTGGYSYTDPSNVSSNTVNAPTGEDIATVNLPTGNASTGNATTGNATENTPAAWDYDPDLGYYTDPNTGAISFSNPTVNTSTGNTSTGNTSTGNTSTGNAQSNLVYDDTTGLYMNPLTGGYSYKAGGLMSLMGRK